MRFLLGAWAAARTLEEALELRVGERVDALRDLVERHESALQGGAIVVVTGKRGAAGFVDGVDD